MWGSQKPVFTVTFFFFLKDNPKHFSLGIRAKIKNSVCLPRDQKGSKSHTLNTVFSCVMNTTVGVERPHAKWWMPPGINNWACLGKRKEEGLKHGAGEEGPCCKPTGPAQRLQVCREWPGLQAASQTWWWPPQGAEGTGEYWLQLLGVTTSVDPTSRLVFKTVLLLFWLS